jgi:hypothetical protein
MYRPRSVGTKRNIPDPGVAGFGPLALPLSPNPLVISVSPDVTRLAAPATRGAGGVITTASPIIVWNIHLICFKSPSSVRTLHSMQTYLTSQAALGYDVRAALSTFKAIVGLQFTFNSN